jgi:hypothetical protein
MNTDINTACHHPMTGAFLNRLNGYKITPSIAQGAADW